MGLDQAQSRYGRCREAHRCPSSAYLPTTGLGIYGRGGIYAPLNRCLTLGGNVLRQSLSSSVPAPVSAQPLPAAAPGQTEMRS
jgi:hypothetical protein